MIFLCFCLTGGIFTFILTRGKILSYSNDTSNITAYDLFHMRIIIRDELAPNWRVLQMTQLPVKISTRHKSIHVQLLSLGNQWPDYGRALFIHQKNNNNGRAELHCIYKSFGGWVCQWSVSGHSLPPIFQTYYCVWWLSELPRDQMSCDGRDIIYYLTLKWKTYSIYIK